MTIAASEEIVSSQPMTSVLYALGTNTDTEISPETESFWAQFSAQSNEQIEDVRSDDVVISSTSAALSGILSQLEELGREAEHDEYGILRPTRDAFNFAKQSVQQASFDLGSVFPSGSVSTDSEGGVRITWHKQDREVQLICPPNPGQQAHIYHESPSEHEFEPHTLSSGRFSRRLRWLAEA